MSYKMFAGISFFGIAMGIATIFTATSSLIMILGYVAIIINALLLKRWCNRLQEEKNEADYRENI